MNMNVSGVNSGISERGTHAESAQKSSGALQSSVPDPITQAHIQSLSDLKQAEMRGENYTLSDEQVVKAVERAIKAMQGKSTALEFTVHEKTKLIAVKVLDKETGEIIREVPPEKTLDFVAKLWEMAGLLVDEKR
ncbi:flagellar protein FlaG [Paenibacillus xanthanilyticus]|uniref:Flagellar protein FlaG n=1 Tax=Paenibacillus xanthanilyticus TaxID=1783531 RepID=A0ABV8K7K8_9BACL